MKLKVDDYLLKDQLTGEQLEQSLGKSVRLLKSKEGLIYRDSASFNNQLFRQDLLQRVIAGAAPEATLDYAAQIGISWKYPWFKWGMVSIHFSSFDKRYKQNEYQLILYAIYNIALELSESSEGITPFLEQENLVILHNYRENLAQNAASEFQQFLRRLRDRCARFLKIEVSIVAFTGKWSCRRSVRFSRRSFMTNMSFTRESIMRFRIQSRSPRECINPPLRVFWTAMSPGWSRR
ncbi:hypothetical protein HMSSN139_19510 [Paenibacillus sp. HMSSN-139]|nr:hypothetical protein HMSSN139_19510 [Paenibacillus sp. HMSSN-139]